MERSAPSKLKEDRVNERTGHRHLNSASPCRASRSRHQDVSRVTHELHRKDREQDARQELES